MHREATNTHHWPIFVLGVSSILFLKFFILSYLLWRVTGSLTSKCTIFCQKEIIEEKFMERNWVCQWRFYLQAFCNPVSLISITTGCSAALEAFVRLRLWKGNVNTWFLQAQKWLLAVEARETLCLTPYPLQVRLGHSEGRREIRTDRSTCSPPAQFKSQMLDFKESENNNNNAHE